METSISLLFKKLVFLYGTTTLLTCVMILQGGGTADLFWKHHFSTLTMTDANKCYQLLFASDQKSSMINFINQSKHSSVKYYLLLAI